MFGLCKIVTILIIQQFFIFTLSQSQDSNVTGVGQLAGVLVIFRHGDRTPIQPYPKDPYKNESLWPVGFGQLTNVGKMRQFELGQWLRKRYKDFLPEKYSEKEVYIRSSDVDRTLMSAEANLAGLYPPSGDQVWDSGLLWQPVPIHTIPEKQDSIIAAKKHCDKYDKLYSQLLKSPEFVNISRKNHDLYSYLTRNSGTLINDLDTLEYLYNNLYIETVFNFSLPKWTESVYPAKMKPLAELSFATFSYNQDLARLKAGPIINEIVDHFKSRISNLSPKEIVEVNISKWEQPMVKSRKFWLYSGHDMTIANVLQSLGIFKYHCPPYASTIIFELRQYKTEFYINIFYKRNSDVEKMTLNGCEFNCPLEQFLKIVDHLLIDERTWEKECNSELSSFKPHVLVILVGLICLILLLLFGFKICLGAMVDSQEKKVNYTYWKLSNEEI